MKKILLGVSLITVVITAFAHEYLFLASKYWLRRGDDLEVHLFVADGFNIQMERTYQEKMTKKFALITPDSVIDLSFQQPGNFPIINRKVDFVGGGLVHMERNYARLSLVTGKFLDYLKEDHIDKVAGKVDLKKKEQKERYTRYIKCLVQSENSFADTLYKKNIGQNFEIVLLKNPYQLRSGGLLQAKIFFMGEPLVGKIITARNRQGSEPPSMQTSITDSNGICSFKINRSGEWFLHATHMIECPDKQDSDWESFWTSYSFSVKER